jgi:hypothetical protein
MSKNWANDGEGLTPDTRKGARLHDELDMLASYECLGQGIEENFSNFQPLGGTPNKIRVVKYIAKACLVGAISGGGLYGWVLAHNILIKSLESLR